MLPISAPAEPAPPPAAPPPAALTAIERVGGILRVARVLIEGGRRVDLTGLDAEIGCLSAYVLDLEPALARRLKPRLVAILAEIESIAARLAAAGPPASA